MKRILFTLVLFWVLMAWPVQAQDGPTISTLDVSVWPEFDRPEALVIYRGVLAPDITLPAPVEIRIPARAGEATAVAYVDTGGQRFNQQHTTRVEGDWLVIAFTLETPGFQLEYYDPIEVSSSGERTYVYTLLADYPIAQFELDAQVPPTAEDFALDPAADSVVVEADGLTYHLVQAQELAQGDELSWTLGYQKDNEDMTVALFAEPTAQAPVIPPATDSPTDLSGDSTIWIFLIAFVALVGVGAVAFWLGRRTQAPAAEALPQSTKQKRRGSGRGPLPSSSLDSADGGLFCYKCGTQLRADSEFCHKCGATVRKE